SWSSLVLSSSSLLATTKICALPPCQKKDLISFRKRMLWFLLYIYIYIYIYFWIFQVFRCCLVFGFLVFLWENLCEIL
ncbi:MAG: hypothetical protein N7Q72_01195, partial [Spiroplasma sp. Tabriz.8]|nr:hypothetical protein [Spiroplasma sp. Tabriz.8]